MSLDMITYEQPFNEEIRLCLRLEHLLKTLHNHIHQPSQVDSQTAMTALIKILNVIDRSDLKTKLAKVLKTQLQKIESFSNSPEVDQSRLKILQDKLNQLVDNLHRTPGRIGEKLRHNAFLKQIRMQANNPGGACHFAIPAYSLWLHQPSESRSNDLLKWAAEFSELNTTINTILNLTRETNTAKKVIAPDGTYQQSLDPSTLCQLVRITLPTNYHAYPEVSLGRHRLVIRFRSLDQQDEGKPLIEAPINFALNCC